MKTWLMELWTDPAKFTAVVRTALFLLGSGMQQGVVPGAGSAMGYWLTFLMQAGALAMPSAKPIKS